MAKRKKSYNGADRTGRSKYEGQYMKLPYVFVHHRQWRSLSGPAAKVWLELRSRFNGGNNGQLRLSQREASKLLGLGKSTVAKAFKELERKGFLVVVVQGDWYGRKATEFRITTEACNGNLPTHDWRKDPSLAG
ncbi:helix-turn-helix domain-containing protein [Albimonas pacifica]|uniref:Helix-turn-helix domain-containing protein n=1 Tax=Albimonas pacifica TaxID=1114924 RepID=A0A1I3PTM9_9RHOB|nr:helix-turn-helix domain-containing protein [Albimonas pacifica]SFJ24988.1 Helix-turn-helix domain-containing protein [Albimonas pacifica]